MTTLIGLGILAVPVAVAVVLLLVRRAHRRQARAIATVPAGWLPAGGFVVDHIDGYEYVGGGTHDGTVFVRTPIIRFVGADGIDRTFRSGIRASYMPRRGTAVTVYYDPLDPTRARIGPESIPRANAIASTVVWTVLAVLFVPFAAMFGFIGAIVLGS